MKKSLLAMAALMGVATLPAYAWRVNIDKESYADITIGTQVWGRYESKRYDSGHNATNFSVNLADIIVNGQVNNLVYFSIDARSENPGLNQPFKVKDAYVGLKFADEFKVQAGAMRIPFSRATLTSNYTLIIPTEAYKDVYTGLNINPTHALGITDDASRDAGIVIWGNVADGMLKYYLGVSDGKFDGRGDFFKVTAVGTNCVTPPNGQGQYCPTKTYNYAKDNLAYTIRLQFTPTMLGFKGEKDYVLADTYLGKQNVLTFGVAYRGVKAETDLPNGYLNYSKTAKLWTVDMLYEQKFGDIVPNLQVGYIQAKDVPYEFDVVNNQIKYGKATQIYAQAQLLYDQVVGFGKPALAIRWEQDKNKDRFAFNYGGTNAGQTSPISGEPKNTRFGVFVNYYIKGQAAKISFGVDAVNRNSDSKTNDPSGSTGKNLTDVTLQLQTLF